LPSWSKLVGWRAPPNRVGWNAAALWAPAFDRVVFAGATRLAQTIERWDARLADVGGDPAREDWSSFRPLRLSREEDWSDWLGHLLERSRSGRFPARLFACAVDEADRWKVARAEREVSVESCRADLVVRFRDEEWAHVEVKVGDLSLAKTLATAQALARHVAGRRRDDFLLLPEVDVPSWEAERKNLGEEGAKIQVLTWHDVTRALRESAIEPQAEPICWRVWALTFLGAVEQHLLDFPPVPRDVHDARYRPSMRDLARLGFLESMEST